MKVDLLNYTPLHIAAGAIRTCWQSQDKSDTTLVEVCNSCGSNNIKETSNGAYCRECESEDISISTVCGPNDRALIDRVGNKFKHASTLEHLSYNFFISGVSRALLQELARHRMASLSVKSSRYTLKELKEDDLEEVGVSKYLVLTGNQLVDDLSIHALFKLQEAVRAGISNDITKYCMPEAYKTSLTWTINARALQNFLSLRSSKAALWEIRDLANAIFTALPEDHKYLFSDCVTQAVQPT